MYTVRGRSGVTVGTVNHAIAQFWNPHATQRIKVVQFGVFKTSAGGSADSFRLKRSTARGTAGSTVTPDIDNHSERAVAPVSGALLDLAAFSVQPTLAAAELGPDCLPGNFPGACLLYDIGIVIPPGTGLVIAQIASAVYPVSGISFIWTEDE